ncbi:hypothetical protein QTO34_007124 [Cnephaeus nilssonii]|uniref:DDE-1 domain-containing protein n=1 Tax=Cnephaeus nilssonii TaxID=3371016 RepID=A0AA40LHH2_CNENI|nr:hypothetical protein QTO34_007124 [Eptesicus nilssonii]
MLLRGDQGSSLHLHPLMVPAPITPHHQWGLAVREPLGDVWQLDILSTAAERLVRELEEKKQFHNIKVQGDMASADVEATASHPEKLAKKRKSILGFKASKDRQILLSGANAAGDFKLKPTLIYYCENPWALKNYAKSTLPMLYKWNNKTDMTSFLFKTWLTILSPLLKPTAKKKKLPFKILLLTDNVLVTQEL